MEHYDYSMT